MSSVWRTLWVPRGRTGANNFRSDFPSEDTSSCRLFFFCFDGTDPLRTSHILDKGGKGGGGAIQRGIKGRRRMYPGGLSGNRPLLLLHA